jgi:hypothetical protein
MFQMCCILLLKLRPNKKNTRTIITISFDPISFPGASPIRHSSERGDWQPRIHLFNRFTWTWNETVWFSWQPYILRFVFYLHISHVQKTSLSSIQINIQSSNDGYFCVSFLQQLWAWNRQIHSIGIEHSYVLQALK